ncbi:hypothetical protein CEXT_165351 [Caerostris extrusa]|uniref:Uncharacterized protein n=1 Tax=Caerostris extrusa TaxID=172846 RepID=A0AAV4T8H5_CAEEX|nr:hypothetical protein CEXT_165351 [Caerostris extrusa]
MFIYRRRNEIVRNREQCSSMEGVMAAFIKRTIFIYRSSAQGKQKKIKAAAAASPTKISFSFGSLLKEKWWHICSAPLAANAESHLDPKDDPADNYQPVISIVCKVKSFCTRGLVLHGAMTNGTRRSDMCVTRWGHPLSIIPQ